MVGLPLVAFDFSLIICNYSDEKNENNKLVYVTLEVNKDETHGSCVRISLDRFQTL